MESCRTRGAALALVVALLWSGASASECGGNISIYWGQHTDEASLADTCASGNFEIVIVAYLLIYKDWQTPNLNLAGHSVNSMVDGIESCQSSGVKVFLSLDGAVGSAEYAEKLASYLSDNYLGGQPENSPLGDAAFDGIDFGVYEESKEHWVDLARALSALSTSNKTVYLSAAPQCPYPDYWLDQALQTGLFHYVWIQFFNNPTCQYADSSPSKLLSAWNEWTESVPTAQNRSFYLGLPAAEDEQTSGGYIDPKILISDVLPQIKASPKYGGVVLWTKHGDEETGYSSSIKPYVTTCDECAGNISIYWGQHTSEASLADTCASGNFEIVIVAYLLIYKNWQTPNLNLAGHSVNSMVDGIESCQSSGVKVFLSLDGPVGSAEDAEKLASYLSDNYLGGQPENSPLGDAAFDGIDFGVYEESKEHWDDLARALSALSTSNKMVYLSAAPQCPYRDYWLDQALRTGLFHYVWIQFFNNPTCQYADSSPSKLLSVWNEWTESVPTAQNRSFYLGLPAAEDEQTSGGYIDPKILISDVLPQIKASPQYGGVALWTKHGDEETGYSSSIKPYVSTCDAYVGNIRAYWSQNGNEASLAHCSSSIKSYRSMKPSLVDVPTLASV